MTTNHQLIAGTIVGNPRMTTGPIGRRKRLAEHAAAARKRLEAQAR